MKQWKQEEVTELLQEHRKKFRSGYTLSAKFRQEQLQKLSDAIRRYEPDLLSALYQDLHKSEFEAYSTEIGFTLDSIRNTKKQLNRWMTPKKVKTPYFHGLSKSHIHKEPYGTVLIIGPFNYPFQLLIEPLIGAISAGNTAVLKPSENTPAVAAVIKKLIEETFDKDYISVVEGEKETTSLLIHAPFDYIFFTGSVPVGKIVMEAAARNLVPLTLELGGKSPAIVDRTANLEVAAKRILWGKMMNAGQTCIAPDYVLAHEEIREPLLDKMKTVLTDFFGADPRLSPDYGRIVNERQFERLAGILEADRAKVYAGGHTVKEELYIEPTLLDQASWSDAAMQDELFGPILPVIGYTQLDEAIKQVNDRAKPLALYLFTEDSHVRQEVLSRVSFGGGCVNDTISHVANPHLPFGGVGHAGIGAYHGKYSFDLFSHTKSVLSKSTKIDISFLFPPYGDRVKWVRKILR
ncbi:aldehyde dehydrogenase [Paenibacillus sp. FSL H8-0048]|uniref:aldehyde dehydrogenase n=1 Tax=Paenibacillus sp. FSL H8-0048 TaxID=2954508 RepID=UPI0030F8765A